MSEGAGRNSQAYSAGLTAKSGRHGAIRFAIAPYEACGGLAASDEGAICFTSRCVGPRLANRSLGELLDAGTVGMVFQPNTSQLSGGHGFTKPILAQDKHLASGKTGERRPMFHIEPTPTNRGVGSSNKWVVDHERGVSLERIDSMAHGEGDVMEMVWRGRATKFIFVRRQIHNVVTGETYYLSRFRHDFEARSFASDDHRMKFSLF